MEDNQSRYSVRPACDLCHARKVKCDRAEKCRNCSIADVECRRTRPHRSLRPRISRIDALKQRLSKYESPHDQYPGEISADSPQSNIIPLENNLLGASGSESTIYTPHESSRRAEEARQFIQQELVGNSLISPHRKDVLSSALDLIAHFSQAPSTLQANLRGLDPDDAWKSGTPPELLYMMIPGIFDGGESSSQHLYWPDHIMGSALEKMLLHLIDNEGKDTISLHYRVCVYTSAFFFTLRSHQSNLSRAVQQRLLKSQSDYKAMALAALGQLQFISSPCLSLVQALLSGAMLMQHMGHMSQSWSLTAFASRTLVSLELHAFKHVDELDEETRSSIYWCYYLDRVLSYLFVRPTSLPKLNVDASSLTPSHALNPLYRIVKIMLRMAEVQEEVLNIQLHERVAMETSKFDEVLVSAESVLKLINETRALAPDLQHELDAAEFGHSALLTNLFKCSPWSKIYHERCLESARNAIGILIRLLTRESEGVQKVDSYPSSLTWTMLLHPLTPYFVLFCNVVTSSHRNDFDLMQTVTKGISQFIHKNEWISKVHSLFNIFFNLCAPLLEQTILRNTSDEQHPETSLENGSRFGDYNEGEEDLFWQLFTTQPSAGWFDADLGS